MSTLRKNRSTPEVAHPSSTVESTVQSDCELHSDVVESPTSQPLKDQRPATASNLGVGKFLGYKCPDVLDWIRRYDILCEAALTSAFRSFPLYCDDEIYCSLQTRRYAHLPPRLRPWPQSGLRCCAQLSPAQTT